MKINYLIVAHKNPQQFQRLVHRLNAPHVFFYVHIDKSVDDSQFKNGMAELSNVIFLESEERKITSWSDISFSEAIIALLERCLERGQAKGYCVLMSGQDYPLRSNKEIYNFFNTNYGKNYISIHRVADIWPGWKDRLERYNFHLPNERLNRGLYPFSDIRCYSVRNFKDFIFLTSKIGFKKTLYTLFRKKRRHPDSFEPMGGSTWYALPIETVTEILDHLEERPELLQYHNHSHVPDEILFHSLINVFKNENEIEKSTTYVNWWRKNVILPVTFGMDDLNELKHLPEHYLFARKFDAAIDNDILDHLDAKIKKEPN